VLSHYRLACINLEGYPPDRRLLGAIGWAPDETINYESTVGDDAGSLDDNMPALEDLPQSEEERTLAMRTVYSSTVRRKDPWGSEQPKRSPRLQATLAAEVSINGVKALALFDSGSTTDSITPEFAFITKAKQIVLEDQVILQLGCVGSRSKISYGTKVPVDIGGVKEDAYFDLVNIDRYDCIIGTPFMNAHGVCLDFRQRCILVNGEGIQAFSFDEEQKYVDKKKALRSARQSRTTPRETAPIHRRITARLPSQTT
jgi:hypothetical protein